MRACVVILPPRGPHVGVTWRNRKLDEKWGVFASNVCSLGRRTHSAPILWQYLPFRDPSHQSLLLSVVLVNPRPYLLTLYGHRRLPVNCELRRGYEGSRKAQYCLHYDTFASYMTKINAVFIIHLIFNSDFPAQLGTLAIHVYGDGFGSLFAQSIDALHSAFCGRKSVKTVLCRWLAFRFIRTNSAFRLRPDFTPLPAIHDHPRRRSMPTSCRSQRPTKRCASVRSTDCQLHHGSTLRRIS